MSFEFCKSSKCLIYLLNFFKSGAEETRCSEALKVEQSLSVAEERMMYNMWEYSQGLNAKAMLEKEDCVIVCY